ncbi:MAG: hypothetical protein HPY50_03545 [Firmicutes bacterium]|nr:hypothetical protein [Bacillota bacterium]
MKTGSSPLANTYKEPAAPILVETALLGQGLPSIDNECIADLWPAVPGIELVWLQEGRVVSGGLEELLAVRPRQEWERINSSNLERSAERKASGYLTASAVLKISSRSTGRIVVTAGMGGVRAGIVSPDLMEIKPGGILIASAFKDTIEAEASLEYLRKRRVITAGWQSARADGFLFLDHGCDLDIRCDDDFLSAKGLGGGFFTSFGLIMFNPLELSKRIPDRGCLERAAAKGQVALDNGLEFHPQVNAALDEMTGGHSSQLQLHALVDNLRLALLLMDNHML